MADRTDTVLIPVIDGEVVDRDATRRIPAPWLRPPVARTYCRRSRWDTFRRSRFAADLRASVHAARYGLAVLAGLLLAASVHCAFPTVAPNDQFLIAVCVAVPLLSVYGLWRLSDPTSRLSRYADADVTPEEIR